MARVYAVNQIGLLGNCLRFFCISNAKMSSELSSYSVQNNSVRDRPASSTRDFVVRVQVSPLGLEQ
jgi:hypothetical protein